MKIEYFILIGLICIYCYPFLLLLIDKVKGTKHSGKQVGWHNGKDGVVGVDECSLHATCSNCGKCGKKVTQDNSQGNWF